MTLCIIILIQVPSHFTVFQYLKAIEKLLIIIVLNFVEAETELHNYYHIHTVYMYIYYTFSVHTLCRTIYNYYT